MNPILQTSLGALYHGDCLELMKQLPEHSVDLIVTDPPYEFSHKIGKCGFKQTQMKTRAGGGFYHNEQMDYIERINESFGMSFAPVPFLQMCMRLLRYVNMYVFTNKVLLGTYVEWAIAHNLTWDILVMAKHNPPPLIGTHYLPDKEFMVYAKHPRAYFNSCLNYNKYKSVKYCTVGAHLTSHPTEKPLGIMQELIEISSSEGQTVLDPYLGSGTTAVAAENLNRRWIGCELNPDYADEAMKRIRFQAGQEKLWK